MRVTAGKYKGRVLIENKFDHIRPTADMVKQAIFNKLNFLLQGANVLDLCAGTGAIGIEALSRGSRVTFVDCDSRSVNLIKQNLDKLGAKAEVLKCDAEAFCKNYNSEKFDIIFFDPPYKSNLYLLVPNLILNSGLLKEEGIFVVEHAKVDKFEWPEGFEVIDEKQYGIKEITYLKIKVQ